MFQWLLESRETGKVPCAKINFGDFGVYQDLGHNLFLFVDRASGAI
jgi:hypothetical protein